MFFTILFNFIAFLTYAFIPTFTFDSAIFFIAFGIPLIYIINSTYCLAYEKIELGLDSDIFFILLIFTQLISFSNFIIFCELHDPFISDGDSNILMFLMMPISILVSVLLIIFRVNNYGKRGDDVYSYKRINNKSMLLKNITFVFTSILMVSFVIHMNQLNLDDFKNEFLAKDLNHNYIEDNVEKKVLELSPNLEQANKVLSLVYRIISEENKYFLGLLKYKEFRCMSDRVSNCLSEFRKNKETDLFLDKIFTYQYENIVENVSIKRRKYELAIYYETVECGFKDNYNCYELYKN